MYYGTSHLWGPGDSKRWVFQAQFEGLMLSGEWDSDIPMIQ